MYYVLTDTDNVAKIMEQPDKLENGQSYTMRWKEQVM